jgi:acyl transferase domain-containing protein
MGCGAEAEGLGIAVIGMAVRFPGASTPDAYWRNLMTARESLTWLGAFEQSEERDDSFAVPAGFLLENVECFDAPFFAMSPREAALTDPQHRVLMECAFNALEHAGYAEASLTDDVGVFVGCGPNYYLMNNLWRSNTVRPA